MKTLPRGATPIDFAYAIHTEVGHQCVGARVNGKIVPLRYELKNGDIIEILTSAGHHPSRDWLALAVTNKARAQDPPLPEHGGEAAGAGDRQEALRARAASATTCPRARSWRRREAEALAQELGVGAKLDDLYAAVGYGKVSHAPGAGAPAARRRSSRAPPAPEKPSPITDAVKRLLRVGEERITVKGSGDLLIYRAKCCNPIMGEPIVGYITRGKGVSVHSQTCPNVVNLMYDPERRIAVEWERGGEGAYEVRIAVQVEDRPGAAGRHHRPCWPP